MWQIVINGPGYFDTPYDLPDGVTSLGRADENDIVLSGDLVSRRHARFKADGDELSVEDLASRNGCRVNGEALSGVRALKAGDLVNIGENAMSVRQPTAAETAETQVVDAEFGRVRHVEGAVDLAGSVLLARNVGENALMRALDNVLPFALESDPPVGPQGGQPVVPYAALALLFKTAEALNVAPSLTEFLEQTADRLMERTGAKTAVVLLRNAEDVLVPAAVRHAGALAEGEVPVSDAIIDEAVGTGAALVVTDVRDDVRFSSRESVLVYGAEQVLCIPIGQNAPFLGVLYLNRDGAEREGLEATLDVCTAVSFLIATGVERFRFKERGPTEERVSRSLERHHPPNVVSRRLAELSRTPAPPLVQVQQLPLTALYAEVGDYGQLVAAVGPKAAADLLSLFRERCVAGVFSFDGSVESFLGASLRAVFGAPYPKPDHAFRAVRAALALQERWKHSLMRRGVQTAFPLRVGIDTGRALAGWLGSDARLDFTAAGEPLEVAMRLCVIAQPGQTLITQRVVGAVGDCFDLNPQGERQIPGVKEKATVFEVVAGESQAQTHPGSA